MDIERELFAEDLDLTPYGVDEDEALMRIWSEVFLTVHERTCS